MKVKDAYSLGRKVMSNLDSIFKSRDITLPTKVCLVKAMVFPVVTWMWELDHKEGWVTKYCFQTMVLEKTLESPLDSKEIKPANPKGINPEYSLEELILKLKFQYFGHLMQSWLFGKDADAGKDREQEEKGVTQDKMVGWHHRLDGHEFEQASGAVGGQGILSSCSPRGHRIGHDWVTELNWKHLTMWITTNWKIPKEMRIPDHLTCVGT